MSSQSDDRKRRPAQAPKKSRVGKSALGHQVWEGTIRTVKLSLMKTGIFYRSEAQKRLLQLRGEDGADSISEDELEIFDDSGGNDPYNSS